MIFVTIPCLFSVRRYLRKEAIPSDGIGFMFTAADGEKFESVRSGDMRGGTDTAHDRMADYFVKIEARLSCGLSRKAAKPLFA